MSQKLNLGMMTALAAALAVSGCNRPATVGEFDDYDDSRESRYCVNKYNQRVKDKDCKKRGSGSSFVYVPFGSSYHGSPAYGQTVNGASRTAATRGYVSSARGGFGSSAHGSVGS